MNRALKNWGDTFFEYTQPLAAPPLFRRWAAIATIAGVLERKVWVDTSVGILYPNLYTIFIAPPGVGKTVMTSTVRKFWDAIKGQHCAASSLTKASLIDDLKDAERTITLGAGTKKFHSLKVISNELGVLLPSYDNEFMSTLTDIYDGHGYSERRRTKNTNFKLDNPQINLLAATTPGYLGSFLPEGAWDQGFLSRAFLVHSDEKILSDIFKKTATSQKTHTDLHDDLVKISKLQGEIDFSNDMYIERENDAPLNIIAKWHMEEGPPAPTHPKLKNYNTRRTSHLVKLCMIHSLMTNDILIISKRDFTVALKWLIELEEVIPNIFKDLQSGGDSAIIEEAYHFCLTYFMEHKVGVPESKLFGWLQSKTSANNVTVIADMLVKTGALKQEGSPSKGILYKPYQHT